MADAWRGARAATTPLYVDAVNAPTAPGIPTLGLGAKGPRPAHPWISSHLEEGALTLRNQGISAEIKERTGGVIEEILSEQAEGDHDLIVVGRHLDGTTRFGAADFTSDIVLRAACPVLVVTGEVNRFS